MNTAMEIHLWINLVAIGKKEKDFLMLHFCPQGFFGISAKVVVDKITEVKVQSAAFNKFTPRGSKSGLVNNTVRC